jgi:hypothetical protein
MKRCQENIVMKALAEDIKSLSPNRLRRGRRHSHETEEIMGTNG